MDDTQLITLYGTSWCGGSRRARLLLDRSKIPYRYVDIDEDEEAARLVEKINRGYRSVPTLVFADGSTLTEPSEAELRRKLGILVDDDDE
jgi:mycoredoxin